MKTKDWWKKGGMETESGKQLRRQSLLHDAGVSKMWTDYEWEGLPSFVKDRLCGSEDRTDA